MGQADNSALSPRLIDLLACPVSKGPLIYDADGALLLSADCGLAYPVRQGIPIMLADEALKAEAGEMEAQEQSRPTAETDAAETDAAGSAADDRDSYYDRVTKYSAERVAPFNLANRRLPSVRETERRLLVERLDLRPGMTVVDTGAGGGYVAETMLPLVQEGGAVICTDTAEHFIASIPEPFLKLVFGMDSFALRSASVERISNLAGLHHVQRKADFFVECHRVLKPGGLAAVADVRADTPPARWLNGPVDRMTDIGHDGMFVAPGEFSELMTKAGFVEVEECHEVYDWRFPDKPAMVSFARDLFRLTRASLEEVEEALYATLPIKSGDGGIAFEWGLIYATGRKP